VTCNIKTREYNRRCLISKLVSYITPTSTTMESQHLPNIQSATSPSSSTAPLAQPAISIAILGAGISGLALAISLLQDPNPNLTFTLYESAPCYSAIGAGIAFGPNALRAMERLAPKFRSLYEGIRTGNADPRKRNVMWDMLSAGPGLREGSKEDGQGEIRYEGFEKSSAHRVELLRVMQSLVPVDRVVFNRRAVDISNVDNGVEITFSDNTTITASAAIGCDGAKGNSRSSVLKSRYPAHVTATYAGRYVYRAVIPIENARDVLGDHVGDGKMFMGKGLYCTVYQMSEGRELNLLAARQSDTGWEGEWTKEVSREEMLADFEHGVDGKLIKLLEVSTNMYCCCGTFLTVPSGQSR
jgi:salicylate hydroxylase